MMLPRAGTKKFPPWGPPKRLRGSVGAPHARWVEATGADQHGEDDVVGTVILGGSEMGVPEAGGPEAGGSEAGTEAGAPEVSLVPGDRVGRYHLLERLGAGGMGVVWVARDPRLGRTVAVKVLHEQRRRRGATHARERLRREALALARLSHPNVVAIYDVGLHERRVFLTMEHVEGRTLDVWAAEGPSLPQVLEVFEQAAAGLAAVHEAGFVHRDFKPTNVMIDRDGRVLVMDFGLARIHDPESVSEHDSTASSSCWKPDGSLLFSTLTVDGVVMGTPAYMAPEQHVGDEADARADQFAFCATLYEVLLGQRPFRGRSVDELAREKHQARLELDGGRLRLPRAVRALLRRGLHPEPSRRYPSMAVLRETLARLRRPPRRRGLAWAALGTAALGGVGWAALSRPTLEPCEAGIAQIALVWNQDAKTGLQRAFDATGLPYADDAAERTTARLDAYAEAWAGGYAEACLAAGHDDEAELDLRMRCLGDARASMAATVELLAQADATAVQRAVTQVAGLPPLTHCEDVEALRAEVVPPADPAMAVALESVRRLLEEAAALDRAGHYVEGRARAEQALQEATLLGYEPSIARARIRVAVLDLGLGDAEASRQGLTDAALLAASIGDHHAAADAATRLIYVLAEELGQPQAALRWARHAEAELDRLPPDRLARARFDGSLGVMYAAQGDHALALAAFERAYAAQRELQGEEHPEVAGALENMALSHAALGRPAEAERIQRRSLSLLEKAVGPQHPDLALSLMNLGYSLDVLGRHDEAIVHYTRALEIFREALHPRHPMVARALGALGHVASNQDRLRDAEAYFRESDAIIESIHGERHREHAWSLAERALVIARLGREEEAVQIYERAREILEATAGPDHDSLAYMLMNESSALVELGRTDEAEPLVERAGEILAKRLEPGHPGLADLHACRGELLRGQGRLAAAREALGQALELSTAALGPDHPEVASILLSLGEVEHEMQDDEAARPHLRRAVEITTQAPVGEGFRAATRFALAEALWSDPAARPEALALARTAQEGFASHDGVFQEDEDEVAAWLLAHPR
jgi:eukaryotic-like serine/threonine-protein kinase